MVYIFTAMYCEARALIEYFHLKKELNQTRFQVFSEEDGKILLTVMGTGMVSAAVAVSSICTAYGAGQEDFLVNVGVAAARSATDKMVLCNKIIDLPSGKTYYPDVLYRHPFLEGAVSTVLKPVMELSGQEGLFDMEAAAVYQAGVYFFAPHQMCFLKVASDHGIDFRKVTREQIEQILLSHVDEIAGFAMRLYDMGKRTVSSTPKVEGFQTLCHDLHCSKTMEELLWQHLRYCALAGVDVKPVIEALYREKKLPCKDKREGKVCFDELKQRLF